MSSQLSNQGGTSVTDRAVLRRRVRSRRGGWYVLAERIAGELAASRPVVVEVDGYGRGWYVTAIDWGRELFEVTRGGDSISVSWSAVRQG